jgi:hypothetical protein
VMQAGSCNFGVTPISESLGSSGGSGNVSVTAANGCGWTAASNANWITLTVGSSGNGNGSVSYSAAANTSNSARTGTLTVAGQVITVTEAGACNFTLSPTSQNVGQTGGTFGVAVLASPGCAWTTASDSPWITITQGSSGSGSGTVNYAVGTNAGTGSRTGTLTIAGRAVTVAQAGSLCTFAVSPGSQGFPGKGGAATVTVTTTRGCSWTAESNSSWITVNSGASRTGSGWVIYTASANPDAEPRTGTLTIAGRTVTILEGASTAPTVPSNVRIRR